ncbi:tRNA (guanine-N(7)-)-methyltransferase non-catalytic subunit TRM82 [Psilocybe cubensis]|uniref:tRNA (Guanine-N(7)-)-methyltransferase non-catalytic subunit TRM82 n=2 Tax=Psilocybe cubensis TaxID=181762 RepID=A0ACB8GV83_PSICU|nr:tRNA (guanine-N(7)-)-methyltransferase non-catalytic subunit TRM82 [Psilocybe cubensis]KAH9479543.1 tRNA (guanine-N(7)-)-methyltransferase non-catalytic subunit TRM82 [Psilocybe cubensis]
MPHYPHSHVFVGPTQTVDIAGPHIQVLDNVTGVVLFSTTAFSNDQKDVLLKSGPVRCAAVDQEFTHVVTSAEDKMLKVWQLDGLKLLSERELPKKPTSVAFTADAQTILVSDKFGDVFSYPFTYVPLTVKQKKDALSSHENPSGGQLILGHASPLNAFLLTPDERYIISADRDEHIRVSWYPKGYNIEMYCLGHLKFVSAIHIPKFDSATLISGGGDPVLKIWDWMTGSVRHDIEVLEKVEPYMAVRALKRKRGYEDGEAPEGGKFRRKKGRGKAKKKEGSTDAKDSEEPETANDVPEEEPKLEKVLVIRRIQSVKSDAGPYILFSAIGTTAVFCFPLKASVASVDIKAFDFGRPVLDFSVVGEQTIVVSLDGEWIPGEGEMATANDNDMIKILGFAGGELFEKEESLAVLASSLNSSLVSATAEEVKKLDLYGDLTSMPKYASDGDIEGEGDTTLPIGAPELSSSETAKGKKGQVELSKKELGRIKTKQAVLAKAQKMEVDGETKTEEEEAPESKRARSDGGSGMGA